MNHQPTKPVTAQRLIATATACGYLEGINPRTKAQAMRLAQSLAGIELAQVHVHTLAWTLAGRRADALAAIIELARTDGQPQEQ